MQRLGPSHPKMSETVWSRTLHLSTWCAFNLVFVFLCCSCVLPSTHSQSYTAAGRIFVPQDQSRITGVSPSHHGSSNAVLQRSTRSADPQHRVLFGGDELPSRRFQARSLDVSAVPRENDFFEPLPSYSPEPDLNREAPVLWSDAVRLEQEARSRARAFEGSSDGGHVLVEDVNFVPGRRTLARGRVPPAVAEGRAVRGGGESPVNQLNGQASVIDALKTLANVQVAEDAPLRTKTIQEHKRDRRRKVEEHRPKVEVAPITTSLAPTTTTTTPAPTTTTRQTTTPEPIDVTTTRWQQFQTPNTTLSENRQLFNLNNVAGQLLQHGVNTFLGGFTTTTTTTTTRPDVPIVDRIAEQAVQILGPNLLPEEVVPYVHNFFPRPSELKDFVSTSPVRLQAGRLTVDLPTNQNVEEARPCRTSDGGQGKCLELQNCPALIVNFRQIRRSICFRRLFLPGVCCPSSEHRLSNPSTTTFRPQALIAATTSTHYSPPAPASPSQIAPFVPPSTTRPPEPPTTTTRSLLSNRPLLSQFTNIAQRPPSQVTNQATQLLGELLDIFRPPPGGAPPTASGGNRGESLGGGPPPLLGNGGGAASILGQAASSLLSNAIQQDPPSPNVQARASCGTSNAPFFRVVGGSESRPGEHPFMAAIFLHGRRKTEFWCGATIISPKHILTAAHCTRDSRQRTSINFNDYVRPVCLPDSRMIHDNFLGKRASVIGWGSVKYGGAEATHLRQALLPIWNNGDCDKAYFQKIEDTFMCAGYATGGKDACQGDSGGPLVYNDNGRAVQIGIVSFGNKCAEPGYPGVYTRLTNCQEEQLSLSRGEGTPCTAFNVEFGVCCPIETLSIAPSPEFEGRGFNDLGSISGGILAPRISSYPPRFPEMQFHSIQEACNMGINAVENTKAYEQRLLQYNVQTTSGTSSALHQQLFTTTGQALDKGKDAEKNIEACRHLVNQFNLTPEQALKGLPLISLEGTPLQDTCPRPPDCQVSAISKYRRAILRLCYSYECKDSDQVSFLVFFLSVCICRPPPERLQGGTSESESTPDLETAEYINRNVIHYSHHPHYLKHLPHHFYYVRHHEYPIFGFHEDAFHHSYDDPLALLGFNSFRRSITGTDLPAARLLTTNLVSDVNHPYQQYTLNVMQWGQFLDHDITHTPIHKGANNTGIRCCSNRGNFLTPELQHPACNPIPIAEDDKFFRQKGQVCMEFVRSLPAPRPDCTFGPREQMNQITGFIDGSNVYGSDQEEMQSLRSFRGGRLKITRVNGHDLLPLQVKKKTECTDPERKLFCFHGGDVRANEQIQLTAMHTLWMREHNRLARELSALNPHYNDEDIYQEARRILAAEMQHITYQEWLPLVLGHRFVGKYQLLPAPMGYTYQYNASLDPTITNEFATAAFRFGHTLVQGQMQMWTGAGIVRNLSLHEHQFSPFELYKPETLDLLIRGLCTQPCQHFDRYFTSEVTDRLFERQGNRDLGLDLVALNIQRGRDHGIAGYTAYREVCGLSRARRFEDLLDYIPEDFAGAFQRYYRHVDDIDLFLGGIAERPLEGSLLGPTFTCIVGDQFARLRRGDRFFYEEGGQTGSFSPEQLAEIRKTSLARVICDNSDAIQGLQPLVFIQPSPINEHVHPPRNIDREDEFMDDTGDSSNSTEDTEPQATDTEPPTTDTEPPTTDTEPPTTHTEPPTTHTEPPTTDTEPPTTHTEPPTTDTEPPTTHTEPPTTDTGPPTTDTESPTTDTETPTTDTEPPTNTEPPTTDTEPPTTDTETPTTDTEPPTTDTEPPTEGTTLTSTTTIDQTTTTATEETTTTGETTTPTTEGNIDPCKPDSCFNGGTCVPVDGESFECKCQSNYSEESLCKCFTNEYFDALCEEGDCGGFCERNCNGTGLCCGSGSTVNASLTCEDINECDLIPGLCGDASCDNKNGSYDCSCEVWQTYNETAKTCDDVDDPCGITPSVCTNIGIPGDNVGECQESEDGHFDCKCDNTLGWYDTGAQCGQIDDCKFFLDGCPWICEDKNISLLDNDEPFECKCPKGLEGDDCQDFTDDHEECDGCEGGKCVEFPDGDKACYCPRGYHKEEDKDVCVRDSECADNPCGDNTECVFKMEDDESTLTCSCREGFNQTGEWPLAKCVPSAVCGPSSCHETARCSQNQDGTFSCECYDFEIETGNGNQVQCDRSPASCSNSTIVEECASKNRMCKEYPQGEIPYECICRFPRVPVDDSCVQIGQSTDDENYELFKSNLPLVLEDDPTTEASSWEALEADINESFNLAFSSEGIVSSSVVAVKERSSADTRNKPHPLMLLRQWLEEPQLHFRDTGTVYDVEIAMLFHEPQFSTDEDLISAIKEKLSAPQDGHCILPGGKLVIEETDKDAITANTDFDPCNEAVGPCGSETMFNCEHTPGRSGSFVCKCQAGFRAYSADIDGNDLCEDINECMEDADICKSYVVGGDTTSVECINKPGTHECRCTEEYVEHGGVCRRAVEQEELENAETNLYIVSGVLGGVLLIAIAIGIYYRYNDGQGKEVYWGPPRGYDNEAYEATSRPR
ncbi:unnamed protein product [Cyprideis torosa]|uniref:Uncharacterized protein n=1 Tax=Cyprideis torosa TaxID=163714 RepID=A0A7R8ZQ36_9CRUS|nr:unnamed protein product [Cyprideis torosa]CAG0891231.1 unnamed protein product [Cyprideis torosa]